MKFKGLAVLIYLCAFACNADEPVFNDNPDVYRAAFYGHLINGGVVVEGIKLGLDESVVQSVSYVHSLKNSQWYRSAKVTAKVLCKVSVPGQAGTYISEIETYLAVDSHSVNKVVPRFIEENDPRLAKRACSGVYNENIKDTIPKLPKIK